MNNLIEGDFDRLGSPNGANLYHFNCRIKSYRMFL